MFDNKGETLNNSPTPIIETVAWIEVAIETAARAFVEYLPATKQSPALTRIIPIFPINIGSASFINSEICFLLINCILYLL